MKHNYQNIDCMEAMKQYPDKYFDLAIVDPPYGLGSTEFVSQRIQKRENKSWNNAIPTEEYFTELYRITKNQIIWGCNYYGANIKDVGRIVFDKMMTHTGPLQLSDCDLASQSFDRRIVKFTYEWRGNVQNGSINWKNTGLDARIHPTQKPIALYKWLLSKYAKQGDKILDTHVGSASSIIACLDMGYEVTGFELDKEYYEKSMKRINDFLAQGKLFKEAI